jgi:thioredoxin reductase (NADPH)
MKPPKQIFDFAIIGAGPIGIELAVTLQRLGFVAIQFDAGQIGQTIADWPRNTPFFSTTERIEIAGVPIQNLSQERTTGEAYLAYLRAIVEAFDLRIHTYEPVVGILKAGETFSLTTRTSAGRERTYYAKFVVIAKGDMDHANELGIPGEDLPHVSHFFQEAHPYFRKRLLIVGGKNSAAEAALRCWRGGAHVTVSYRRPVFDDRRVKHWLLPDLETQIELGTIGFLPNTVPVEITPGTVVLANVKTGERTMQAADFVLLLTGYRQNMDLFEQAGVELVGAQQVPRHDPDTMETNIPGLYLAGTTAAGAYQPRYRLFIENTHVHVGKIIYHITGKWPEKLGTIPERQYELPLHAIEAN